MDSDPMFDVPEPGTRYPNTVPWGIILMLAAIPVGAVLYLLLH